MADPISTQIIDNVVSTIGAIEAGATYNRTVRNCTRRVYYPSEISQYDTVFVYDMGTAKNYLASETDRKMLSITLNCWVQDGDNPAQAIDHLAADVEKALMVDCHRGNLAIDTYIKNIRKVITQDLEGEATCEIDIDIEFRHQHGDPYTAIGG